MAPRFQGIERIWINGDEALGLLTVRETPPAEFEEYRIHPIVLDACFQVMGAIGVQHTYLPVKVERIGVFVRPGAVLWCHARLTEKSDKSIRGDLRLMDETGFLLAEITGLCCRRVEGAQDMGRDSLENMRYEYRWMLDDRSADANREKGIEYLPAPGAVAESLEERIAALATVYERDTFNTVVMPELHALSGKYVIHALGKLGWSFESAEPFTTESLAETLGVAPEHRRLFGRMLEILAEDGLLKKDGLFWKCAGQPLIDDPADGWRALIQRRPSFHAELNLLHRCGSRLVEVLRGEEDPLSLIFPKNSLLTEHLYHDSPSFKFYNRLMQLIMGGIVDRTPEGQPLRILEIGAGTGAMATQILRVLPAHRTRYVFTDISRAFTSQAEQKFRSISSCVDFMVLDIEKDPKDQGFQPNSFDIVLASDVLHATSDLRNTMTNIKSLLAPGGLLLFIEITTPHRWFDLVFGMLTGWWLFADHDIRPSSPLMPKSGWLSLLPSLGFPEVEAIPEMEGENESQHSIIIATRPRHRPEYRRTRRTARIDGSISGTDRKAVADHRRWGRCQPPDCRTVGRTRRTARHGHPRRPVRKARFRCTADSSGPIG